MPESPDTRRCTLCGHPLHGGGCDACGGGLVDPISHEPIQPRRGLFLFDLLHGFWLFWRGALLLFHRPEYAGTLKGPVIANLLVAAALLGLEYWLLVPLAQVLAGEHGWLGFLRPLVGWDDAAWTTVLATQMGLWLAPVGIVALSAPLTEPLVAAIERSAASGDMAPVPLNHARRMSLGVRAAARLGAIQLLLLPAVVLLASFRVGFLLVVIATALFTALAWLELPLVRRGRGLVARQRLLRTNWARAVGFGLAAQLGLLLPVFDLLLFVPSAAAGITLLHLHAAKGTAPATNVEPVMATR